MGMDCVQDKCIRREKTVGADFKGQNKLEGNKYESRPIINVFFLNIAVFLSHLDVLCS